MGARRKSPNVRSSRPPGRGRFNPTRTINRRRPESGGGGQVSITDGSFLSTFVSPPTGQQKLQEEMKKSGVKQVGKTIKKGGGTVSIDDGPMLGGAKPGGGEVSIDDGPVPVQRRRERRRARGRRRMAGGRNIRSITRRAPQSITRRAPQRRESGAVGTIRGEDGRLYDDPVPVSRDRDFRRRDGRGTGAVGRRMIRPGDRPIPSGERTYSRPRGQVSIDDGPMLRGRNPESGVRYKRDGTPTAVQQTERVDVQDPTLGGRPEREVPNDRGIARDRLRRRVRERREANRQERSMRREEQSNIKSALASERGIRASERDFTRKRSAMEGG